MASLLAVDHRVDLHQTVLALVPALNADGYTVRNLAVKQAQHLLADNFSDKLTLRLIGYHVLREQLWAFDGILVDFGEQLLYALARACRDRHNRVELMHRRVGRNDSEQLLLLDGVDLIDDEDCRHVMLLDLCNQAFLSRTDVRDRLYHQNGNVHLGNRVRHHLAHVVAQTGARLVQTRGVQQNILRFTAAEYARNARARGLRLAGYDSHLLAHQLVCQRGFAHVRPSYNGYDRSFCNLAHYLSPVQ